MKNLERVTSAVVWHAWLKSEARDRTSHFTARERDAIDLPIDHTDLSKPVLRDLLMRIRGAIVGGLPKSLEWSLTEIFQDDVERLYILPIWDWYLDTGGTFALSNTVTSLANRRSSPPLPPHPAHFKKVREIQTALGSMRDSAGPATYPLVLICAEASGPWTIIDGTHRACAYLRSGYQLPWLAYVGQSTECMECRWHCASPSSGLETRKAAGYVARGLLR